ncbi:MAG: ATPase, T2SS/T4P/T4SS family [Acidobacteriota bacterium]
MENSETFSSLDQIGIVLSPVCDLINDESVTDIFIYGKDKVFVKRFGEGMESVQRSWEEDIDLIVACNTIAQHLKKKLNFDYPILDGRLDDGSRINILISPVYTNGACISIRKFPVKKLTFNDFLDLGSIDQNGIEILKAIVILRKNIIISGGTGTGKTTLLNLLCGFISDEDIIVTIEDARELDITHSYWAPVETKKAYYEDDTSISLRDLVKNSLRMFPEWIILGEVRSGEVFDLMRAFNSGHSGMSSLHADSCEDAMFALENMFLQGMEMRIEAVRHMISRAVDVVVQITRFPDNKIRITDISEIRGIDQIDGLPQYNINKLYEFELSGIDDEGNSTGNFLLKNKPDFIKDLLGIYNNMLPDFWQ